MVPPAAPPPGLTLGGPVTRTTRKCPGSAHSGWASRRRRRRGSRPDVRGHQKSSSACSPRHRPAAPAPRRLAPCERSPPPQWGHCTASDGRYPVSDCGGRGCRPGRPHHPPVHPDGGTIIDLVGLPAPPLPWPRAEACWDRRRPPDRRAGPRAAGRGRQAWRPPTLMMILAYSSARVRTSSHKVKCPSGPASVEPMRISPSKASLDRSFRYISLSPSHPIIRRLCKPPGPFGLDARNGQGGCWWALNQSGRAAQVVSLDHVLHQVVRAPLL